MDSWKKHTERWAEEDVCSWFHFAELVQWMEKLNGISLGKWAGGKKI